MKHAERIVILDFGGQTTQLIARRLREQGVYCEILPFNAKPQDIRTLETKGIIFSGGPASVHADGSPHPDNEVYALGLPLLGICYGMQLLGEHYGSPVVKGKAGEFGPAQVNTAQSRFVSGLSASDASLDESRRSYRRSSRTARAHGHKHKRLNCGSQSISMDRSFGVQFHPEVTHTPEGWHS